jgi:hypothetical protein
VVAKEAIFVVFYFILVKRITRGRRNNVNGGAAFLQLISECVRVGNLIISSPPIQGHGMG